MKTLRVGKFPGVLKEVLVSEETTVAEVLEMAELNAEGFQIELDGDVVDGSKAVGSGNLLVLAKKVKGAIATIRVGKFPGVLKEIAIAEDTTVGEALEMAELDSEGFQIELDGDVVDKSKVIGNGNLLVLAKKVKGAK